jgi:hypothetical protein
MAIAQGLGYRNGLVDPAGGQISRQIFVNGRDLPAGQGNLL